MYVYSIPSDVSKLGKSPVCDNREMEVTRFQLAELIAFELITFISV